ncbi:MAG: CDP-alcohol phosphatidyltransferase family protein [Acidimicrobiia bacterium]|nr:CDP-alcohol phosphatidyltransferase family protein [Acidimicrobiia bacterium]
MFDGSFRTAFDRVVAPLGRGLQRLGVSPDVITVFGILMAASCGLAIGLGRFWLAAVLLALTGLPDALDGAVAKAGGREGPRGAYLDSVSDRVSDSLLFAGAGWYLAGTDNPRMVMLPFALFIAASLVSYQRAKAESLGFVAKGGLMERAERFIALGFGLIVYPLFVPVLWIMLTLTTATAVYRFYKVWGQASGTIPVTEPTKRLRSGRARRRNRRSVADFRQRAQARAEARRRNKL